MDLVFPAEHGLLTARGLSSRRIGNTTGTHASGTFQYLCGLPRWLADGMSVVCEGRCVHPVRSTDYLPPHSCGECYQKLCCSEDLNDLTAPSGY